MELTEETADSPSLWKNPNLIFLWLGQFISSLGDWALWMAVPITVYQKTNSTVDLAFTLVTEGVPLLLVAPIAGVMVDRWNRRRTLITVDIGRGLMVCLLVAPGGVVPLWMYYLVLFVNSALSSFFAPARSAMVTQIVPRRQFMRTNALLSSSMQISEAIGPAVGGFVFTLFSRRGSFICDALSFVVSALCIALVTGIKSPSRAKHAGGIRGIFLDLAGGLAFIRTAPVVRALVLMGPLIYVVTTIFNAPEYAFARDFLHATPKQYGILLSAAGLGVLVGGAAIVTLLHRFAPLNLLVIGLVLATIGGVGYGLSPNYLWALFPHFILGLGGILASIPLATLIQTFVPSDILGRVYGAWSIFTRAAQIISGAAAGFLAAAIPIPRLYVGNSFLFLILAVLAMIILRPALLAKDNEAKP